jgi:DNA-binding IclR family transcriptional regulator
MIAVPVRADSGAVFGCLELLNPPTEFSGQDFEIAARVAASLGAFLASVDAVR